MAVEAPDLLTVKEAAHRLGVNYKTLYGYVRSGKVPSVKIGWLRRIGRAWVEQQVAAAGHGGNGSGERRESQYTRRHHAESVPRRRRTQGHKSVVSNDLPKWRNGRRAGLKRLSSPFSQPQRNPLPRRELHKSPWFSDDLPDLRKLAQKGFSGQRMPIVCYNSANKKGPHG